MLCCAVLYCTVLCYVMLYCNVLCSVVLCGVGRCYLDFYKSVYEQIEGQTDRQTDKQANRYENRQIGVLRQPTYLRDFVTVQLLELRRLPLVLSHREIAS